MMTEELRQLSRSLREKVIAKAIEDPQFRQQLIDDPEAAEVTIENSGHFPEVQQIQDVQQNQDVTGQGLCTVFWSGGLMQTDL